VPFHSGIVHRKTPLAVIASEPAERSNLEAGRACLDLTDRVIPGLYYPARLPRPDCIETRNDCFDPSRSPDLRWLSTAPFGCAQGRSRGFPPPDSLSLANLQRGLLSRAEGPNTFRRELEQSVELGA